MKIIEHVNGNPNDNSIPNLRIADMRVMTCAGFPAGTLVITPPIKHTVAIMPDGAERDYYEMPDPKKCAVIKNIGDGKE